MGGRGARQAGALPRGFICCGDCPRNVRKYWKSMYLYIYIYIYIYIHTYIYIYI